jgi:hypothetical protein
LALEFISFGLIEVCLFVWLVGLVGWLVGWLVGLFLLNITSLPARSTTTKPADAHAMLNRSIGVFYGPRNNLKRK